MEFGDSADVARLPWSRHRGARIIPSPLVLSIWWCPLKLMGFEEFARIVGGELRAVPPQSTALASERPPISGFALDNREVKPGDLFVAIAGERVDGHEFAGAAVAAGAVGALVERPLEGVTCVVVDSVVDALARLGRHFRDQFDGPVVGVTGSAGKTTTKELIVAALSPRGLVLRAEGNRNTEYTSPLLWTELSDGGEGGEGSIDHPFTPSPRNPWAAVVEMGMRGFGQIAHLASISKPTIGVITNIGWSHAELVGSREGIARAKGELLQALPEGAPAVLWQDDEFLSALKAQAQGPVYTFGWTEAADCRITDYRAKSWWSCEVEGRIGARVFRPVESGGDNISGGQMNTVAFQWRAELPAVGRHIALNAAAAMLVAVLAGVSPRQAAQALKSAKLPPMRMEVRSVNGGTVVLDTYNAAPNSVVAALETLREVPCEGRRLAVLGEMRELGSASEEGHRLVGRAVVESGVDEVVFYGATAEWMRDAAIGAGMAADRASIASSLDEVTDFIEKIGAADTMLIKGSRSLELERALEPLEVV